MDDKLIDIEAHKPHQVCETMCWNCGNRTISVFPAETLLKQLECGHCHAVGYLFKTGQALEGGDDNAQE